MWIIVKKINNMKKLIRDKIPEIIKSEKRNCEYYIASDFEYSVELFKKIVEESLEVQNSKNKDELIEEIADVYEVINSICKNNWIDKAEINKVRLEKKEKRWWFDKKYILEMDD